MSRIRLIMLVFILYPAMAALALPIKYSFTVTANKTSVVVGSPVTLTARLKAAGLKAVDQAGYDDQLAKINGLQILNKTFGRTTNGIFEHTVIFTAIKPGTIALGGLHIDAISANEQFNAVARPVSIDFTNEPLPASLSDIKGSDVGDNVPVILAIIFVLFVIIAAFFIPHFRVSKKTGVTTSASTKNELLQRLQLLEQELGDGKTEKRHIGDKAFQVLKEYLAGAYLNGSIPQHNGQLNDAIAKLELGDHEKQEIADLLKTSGRIRFSHQNKAPDHLSAHLHCIKVFIANSPPHNISAS